MRWIIVSNRLPFSLNAAGEMVPSSGGLVTALSGVQTEAEQIWAGMAPTGLTEAVWAERPAAERQAYQPVFIDEALYDAYYNGMANDVFWPLFHYEGSLIRFEAANWAAYQAVNQQVAEAVAAIYQPGDVIWVHDFHLFLLPQLLRDLGVTGQIGFFLHIPFPSSELFRQLPVRQEILTGLLGADLIGFHDYAYLRHFCNTLLNVLNLDSNMLSLSWQGREVRLGVYPVSIDVGHFQQEAATALTHTHYARYRAAKTYRHLILGVDRLDYSKGLGLKLQAFAQLLAQHPELRGQVSLLQLAVPTRQDVPAYQDLRAEFERQVGEINGAYSQPNYVPVQYMYTSVAFHELLALYQLADVLLVTSRRDGMNLVALEYIVSQAAENPGVVVLSEFTGASSMLSHALITNPWDMAQTAERLHQALNMPLAERLQRQQVMAAFLSQYTASDWAANFMRDLHLAHLPAAVQKNRQLQPAAALQQLGGDVQTPLLIFVDYDGTLVPICERPEDAVLPTASRGLLARILQQPNIELVVVSGRDAAFLQAQFGDLPVTLAAEHGATYYEPRRGEWQSQIWSQIDSWYPSAEAMMADYSRRVPGSHVERKQAAVAWHYRQSPPEFAHYQAHKLKEDLEVGLSNLPVTVISGKKVIEARAVEANKGYFARNYLDQLAAPRRCVAIGDDTTDEDLMLALPPESLTVKVGAGHSQAGWRLPQTEVLPLLLQLAGLAAD